MIWVPHQLLGLPFNTNVTLECFTEAHPTSLNYWTRDDGHMIHDSKKYRYEILFSFERRKTLMWFPFRTESFIGTPNYKTHMKLHIFNVQRPDVGSYKCVAKNPRYVFRCFNQCCHSCRNFLEISRFQESTKSLQEIIN